MPSRIEDRSNRHAARQAIPRRAFLADVGMGFTGLALGEMLLRDGVCRAERRGGVGRRPTASRTFRPGPRT